jgi:hypothetical protein
MMWFMRATVQKEDMLKFGFGLGELRLDFDSA